MNLNEIFAFCLCDQWLELGGGKGIDETGFRNHEEKDLSTSEDGQFVSL